MLYTFHNDIVNPETVIRHCIESVYSKLDTDNKLGYCYSQQSIFAIEILEVGERRSRLLQPYGGGTKDFEYPVEDGFWITGSFNGTTFAHHFDGSKISDHYCFWTDDIALLSIYRKYFDNAYDKTGKHVWKTNLNPFGTVCIWIEHFEHNYIFNFAVEGRFDIYGLLMPENNKCLYT